MRVALFNGLIGLLATLIVGTRVLGMSFGLSLATAALSLAVGLFCLLTTLAAERNKWIKGHILRGTLLTWGFLVLTYFGFLLALAPQMRDVEHLTWLFIPLMLTHGWTIIIFGPIQDWIVRRMQRKSHLAL